MKIVLVSPEVSDFERIQKFLGERDRSDVLLFHYYHPLKAIDNLEELVPDIIFWSIVDFPRHWKTLIPFARGIASLDRLKMVLFSSHSIDSKELDKANALEVTDIIQQGLASPEAMEVIDRILASCPAPAADARGEAPAAVSVPADINETLSNLRYIPESPSILSLIMTHPLSLKIIRGKILAVDPDSIEFNPENPSDLSDLPTGAVLKSCRLKIGEYRIQLDLKLRKLDEHYDLIIQDPEKEYIPILTQLLHGKIV